MSNSKNTMHRFDCSETFDQAMLELRRQIKLATVSGPGRRFITIDLAAGEEKLASEIKAAEILAEAGVREEIQKRQMPVLVSVRAITICVDDFDKRQALVKLLRSKGFDVGGNGDGGA